jgi:signal transduction histidine kinase
MKSIRPLPKFVGLAVLLAMAGFVAFGFLSIRRSIDNLRVISQDNILWSATQFEVELLRFQVSVARLGVEHTDESLEAARNRFDILWSRVFMMGKGRVGDLMRQYDEGHGSLEAVSAYLETVDPILAELEADDLETVRALLSSIDDLQRQLRLYTLRVVRADTAASTAVRERIQSSSQTTGAISLAAVLLSAFALVMILRENRRQRHLVDMNRRVADSAELSSRAKSRFLSMMSHELRNPLNAILGPLALLGQSNLGMTQKRLVDQATSSGQSMAHMLAGLLDYGEVQDGRFRLNPKPFALAALAASVGSTLSGERGSAMQIRVAPGAPERVLGDLDRLRQIVSHLCEYLLEAVGPDCVELVFRHDGENLMIEIAISIYGPAVEWKLDLLVGLGEVAPDQVSADALRPLIARGLISASGGRLRLDSNAAGRRAVIVRIPAEALPAERILVRLETRSVALATIYQAALRSECVIFLEREDPAPADMVLVDINCMGEGTLMTRLRCANPDAVFISLGLPRVPGMFDEVVENPSDMRRLRNRILDRMAS